MRKSDAMIPQRRVGHCRRLRPDGSDGPEPHRQAGRGGKARSGCRYGLPRSRGWFRFSVPAVRSTWGQSRRDRQSDLRPGFGGHDPGQDGSGSQAGEARPAVDRGGTGPEVRWRGQLDQNSDDHGVDGGGAPPANSTIATSHQVPDPATPATARPMSPAVRITRALLVSWEETRRDAQAPASPPTA